jgi:hypothetical protein
METDTCHDHEVVNLESKTSSKTTSAPLGAGDPVLEEDVEVAGAVVAGAVVAGAVVPLVDAAEVDAEAVVVAAAEVEAAAVVVVAAAEVDADADVVAAAEVEAAAVTAGPELPVISMSMHDV